VKGKPCSNSEAPDSIEEAKRCARVTKNQILRRDAGEKDDFLAKRKNREKACQISKEDEGERRDEMMMKLVEDSHRGHERLKE